jgi:hypothetical protein
MHARFEARCKTAARRVGLLIVAACTASANAQLSSQELDALRTQGLREGWTFAIAQTPATQRDLSTLCNLRIPPEWAALPLRATPRGAPADPVLRALPTAFDWRAEGGCTPVKDQADCGSCWAFATVGPLECNILIQDAVTVDLAEQWLVSCNTLGYGCDGGWFAHEHHRTRPDGCGGAGAVLEAAFPYVAADVACGCPYVHAYTIAGWAYVDTGSGIPTVDAIKQAIYAHGPVAVGVYVDATFSAYGGGVYNACPDGTVNHAVVLVGWDDSQGTEGVWILRNSWGAGWGEAGYMRIEYNCARVGYAANFVEYLGNGTRLLEVTPAEADFGTLNAGETDTITLTVKNVGTGTVTGTAAGLTGPFTLVGSGDYELDAGETTTLTVQFTPTLVGDFSSTLALSGHGLTTVAVSGTATGDGVPADRCAAAPTIGDGTYAASTTAADTERNAACGGGGAGDVWWKFAPAADGIAIFDTVGSDFDTVISVYSACGGAELGCNDDAAVGVETARLSIAVAAGQTYLVRVAGCAGERGTVALEIVTTPEPVQISGHVRDDEGAPVSGVTLSGLPGDPLTDIDGTYVAEVPYDFSDVVTPVKAGWTFTPAQRVYASITSAQVNENYLATRTTCTIAGRVLTPSGSPVPFVTINGLPDPVTTGADGTYTATVANGFTGHAAPQLAGYTFVPSGRDYDGVLTDRPTDDYEALPLSGALQIALAPAAVRPLGAAWCVDGGDWQASGASVTNLAVGAHTVDYAPVEGWSAPPREIVSVVAGQTAVRTRTYTPQRCTLSVVVHPQEGGAVSATPEPDDAGQYDYGTVVTLRAEPARGYRLAAWSGTDDGPSGDPAATVTLTGDVAVVVEFTSAAVAAGFDDQDGGLAPLACGGGCGAGSFGLLPVMMAGLSAMKWRLRRGQR